MTRRIRVLIGILTACALALGIWLLRGRAGSNAASGSDVTGQGKATTGKSARSGRQRQSAIDDSGPTFRVGGTVLEMGTSRGVGGGEVVFSGPRGETTTRADEGGHYEVSVRPGSYHVFVRGSGVVTTVQRARERLVSAARLPSGPASEVALAPVVAVTQDEAGVDLQVRTSVTVSGRVANRSGQPVSHAVVRARGAERPVLGTDIAETDADGAFNLELPSGSYQIDASHADYAGLADASTTLNVEAPARPSPLSLTLVAGCVISGRVLASDGAPSDEGSVDQKREGMSDFQPSASIAKDGTFRWTTIEEGDVTLRAWAWMSPPTTPETFHCTDGARIDATLSMPPADSDLDGTLTSSGGASMPFAFLDIVALSPGGISQDERTDANGRWAVFTMPPGDYLVTANLPGEGFVERRVTVPSHEVDLTLGGIGAISGTIAGVRDGSIGMEVSACNFHPSIYLYQPAETRLVSVHDGHFKLDGVAACEHFLRARVDGRTDIATVAVSARGETAATLDLSPPPAVAEVPPEPIADPAPIAVDPAPAPEPQNDPVAIHDGPPNDGPATDDAPEDDQPADEPDDNQ